MSIEDKFNQAEAELAEALKEEGKKERLIEIPLGRIIRDKKLQPRVGVKTETIERYAEIMLDDAKKLPPIKAFYDRAADCYWVWDGWTRIAARETLFNLSPWVILGLVKDGTREDAIVAAAGANADHGEPRTAEDQVRAITNLLTEVESWRAKSDREIAKACHLGKNSGHKQVARVYERLVKEGLLPPRPEHREGADGKTRKPPTQTTGSSTQLESQPSTQTSLLISSPVQSSQKVMGVFDQAEQRSQAKSSLSEGKTQETPQKEASTISESEEELERVVFLCLFCGKRDFPGIGEMGEHSRQVHGIDTQCCFVRYFSRCYWVKQGYYYPATLAAHLEIPIGHELLVNGVRPSSPLEKITLEGAEVRLESRPKAEASITYVDYNTGEPAQATPQKRTESALSKAQAKAGEEGAASAAPSKKVKLVKVKCPQCQGVPCPPRGHPCYACKDGIIEAELVREEGNGNGEKNQHYNTPPDLADPLRLLGEFGLDPCHNDGSILKARVKITEKQDGLSDKWNWADLAKGDLVIINPPYNNITPWVDRVILEAARGANEVLIVPNRSDADWHHKASESCKLMAVIKGRVNFLKDGVPDKSPQESTILFYWGSAPGRFGAVAKLQGWRVTQDLTVDAFAGSVAQLKEEEANRRQGALPLEVPPQSEPPRPHEATPANSLDTKLRALATELEAKGYTVTVLLPRTKTPKSVEGALIALPSQDAYYQLMAEPLPPSYKIPFVELDGRTVICTLVAIKKEEQEFPSPWMTRALKAISEARTQEECLSIANPILEKASTDEERAKLTETLELTKAKLPHAENVRSPRKEEPTPLDKGLAEMSACTTDADCLKVYDKLISKYINKTQAERDQIQAARQAWLKAHQQSLADKLTAELLSCNYVSQGQDVYLRFEAEASSAYEKSHLKKIFTIWKKEKPASKPYNAKASVPPKKQTTLKTPKPKRNAGKNEEKKVSKRGGRR